MIPKSSFPLTCATTAPIIGLLGLAQSLTGQILISRWDFNSGSLSPESGLGEALLVGGTSATFAAGYQGEPTGGWNIKGFPTQGTLPGTAGVQFNLSTEGFSSVGLFFQIRHSNTSANSERVLWSIDGQPFTEAGRFTITPASTADASRSSSSRSPDSWAKGDTVAQESTPSSVACCTTILR
jgi:hypothetical protein